MNGKSVLSVFPSAGQASRRFRSAAGVRYYAEPGSEHAAFQGCVPPEVLAGRDVILGFLSSCMAKFFKRNSRGAVAPQIRIEKWLGGSIREELKGHRNAKSGFCLSGGVSDCSTRLQAARA
ncbi:unnamed protein product [Arctogadus glacialis]